MLSDSRPLFFFGVEMNSYTIFILSLVAGIIIGKYSVMARMKVDMMDMNDKLQNCNRIVMGK
jgi:hypothetical protein